MNIHPLNNNDIFTRTQIVSPTQAIVAAACEAQPLLFQNVLLSATMGAAARGAQPLIGRELGTRHSIMAVSDVVFGYVDMQASRSEDDETSCFYKCFNIAGCLEKVYKATCCLFCCAPCLDE